MQYHKVLDFGFYKSKIVNLKSEIRMVLNNELIKNKLTEKFGDQLSDWQEPYGMLTFTAAKELNIKVMQFLFDDETLRFNF